MEMRKNNAQLYILNIWQQHATFFRLISLTMRSCWCVAIVASKREQEKT